MEMQVREGRSMRKTAALVACAAVALLAVLTGCTRDRDLAPPVSSDRASSGIGFPVPTSSTGAPVLVTRRTLLDGRVYFLHLGARADHRAPLVVALHAAAQDAAWMQKHTELSSFA